MEWLLLAATAIAAAVGIAVLPLRARVVDAGEDTPDLDELRAERDGLLAALRNLDDDVAAGRIDANDRLRGRRALGPQLRTVMEQLRAEGADPR